MTPLREDFEVSVRESGIHLVGWRMRKTLRGTGLSRTCPRSGMLQPATPADTTQRR